MNLKNKSDVLELSKGSEHWYRRHTSDRANMKSLVADFAGDAYAKNQGINGGSKTLINLLQLMVVSLSTALAYNRPRVKVPTDVQTSLQFAKKAQFSMNKYVEQLKLEKILRKIVFDAIFYMGIAKVGGPNPIDRVSPDNCVYDAGQGDIRKALFIGDRYRLPIRKAKKDERFDPKNVEKLTPTTKSDREDISNLTASLAGDDDEDGEIEPMVDLADMWVEAEQKVYTFRCLSKFRLDAELGPLGDGVPIDNPDTGCYRFLSLLEVPDNADPLPLASAVQDLFRIINILLFKMTTRAKKMRDIPTYVPGAEDDMQRAMFAGDLQPIKVKNKDDIGLIKLFGVDQQLQGFIYSLIEIFKQGAGNLDALVGLSPSADTLGQSQMVAGQVGARIANYRNLTNEFVTEVMGDLFDEMWHSPDLVVRGTGTVPNTKYNYDNSWWPDSIMPRQGQRQDFKPTIEPYSMEYQTPAMGWAKFKEGLNTLAPFYPAGQAQGVQFDFMILAETAADLLDTPTFLQLFKQGAMPAPEQPEEGGIADNQPHEYIRRNVSGGADANGTMQQLMQGQPQGGETEQAMSVE